MGWLSVVVDDVGDRRCHEGCRWGCWKGCATGPLPGRMAGHSGLCRSPNRAVVGFVEWAWLLWLVSGVGRCARVPVLGVWVVPAAAGCVVDEREFGAVSVAYVVMLVVGMVPVGRRDVGAAVFGMAAAAYGSGGRLGGRLGSPLVVRGCIPPMK